MKLSRYKKTLYPSTVLVLCVVLLVSSAAWGSEETELSSVYTASTYTSEVAQYGMLPIYGRDIADGTYPVASLTNSTYFKLHEPMLTVDGDSMEVTFYIASTSYTKVYMGTRKEAAVSDEADQIQAQVRDDCTYFTIPVEALDESVYCAAYSKSRRKWYGRQLLFLASSLPEEALSVDLPDYDLIEAALDAYQHADGSVSAGTDMRSGPDEVTEDEQTEAPMNEGTEDEQETQTVSSVFDDLSAVTVGGKDGEYSIEVAMTGGSGRASVSSPTYLTVVDGRAYATILWSSTHYDYMIMDGKRYENEAVDGGISRFTIPITVMDEPIDIIADTTAMGDPVEISYTLTFYEESIGDRGLIPQEAAKRVLIMAVVMIALGTVLNYWVQKRRRYR